MIRIISPECLIIGLLVFLVWAYLQGRSARPEIKSIRLHNKIQAYIQVRWPKELHTMTVVVYRGGVYTREPGGRWTLFM